MIFDCLKCVFLHMNIEISQNSTFSKNHFSVRKHFWKCFHLILCLKSSRLSSLKILYWLDEFALFYEKNAVSTWTRSEAEIGNPLSTLDKVMIGLHIIGVGHFQWDEIAQTIVSKTLVQFSKVVNEVIQPDVPLKYFFASAS